MTIREKLVKEGKEGAIDVFDYIKGKTETGTNNPVWHQQDRYGNPVFRVEGKDVLVGLGVWMALIDVDESSLENTPLLDALLIYANSVLDIGLHNYANALVRGSEPDESVEELRDLAYFVDTIYEIQYGEYFL